MSFNRIQAAPGLEKYINSYWTIQDEDNTPVRQKIIPDGYPEIIFHTGDAYRIQLYKQWELQHKALFAGQIRKFFFLENTGQSSVFGIKLQPAAATHLFEIQMNELTDKVVAIDEIKNKKLSALQQKLFSARDFNEMISIADKYFLDVIKQNSDEIIDRAIDLIIHSGGSITVNELVNKLYITERQLQRLFKKYIGLSPKFYSRIIRFNYIFELMQNQKLTWSDVVSLAGYYDQSHFIRDFKSFTGEDPSKYIFEENNLANFFLNKK